MILASGAMAYRVDRVRDWRSHGNGYVRLGASRERLQDELFSADPMRVNVTCEEIRGLLSPFADGELDLLRTGHRNSISRNCP